MGTEEARRSAVTNFGKRCSSRWSEERTNRPESVGFPGTWQRARSSLTTYNQPCERTDSTFSFRALSQVFIHLTIRTKKEKKKHPPDSDFYCKGEHGMYRIPGENSCNFPLHSCLLPPLVTCLSLSQPAQPC